MKNNWCLLFVVVAVAAVRLAAGARILIVFPVVTKSHFAVGEALADGLAKVGHQVTLVGPYVHKSNMTNMESVQLTGAVEAQEGRYFCVFTYSILRQLHCFHFYH